jgi:hypothetical protein
MNKSLPKETFDSILMPGDIGLSGQFQRLLKPTERNRTEAILASSCAMKWMFAWTAKIMPRNDQNAIHRPLALHYIID